MLATKRSFLGSTSPAKESISLMSDDEWARQKSRVDDALYRSKGYLTTPPTDRESMPVTTPSGRLIYAAFEDDQESAKSDLFWLRSRSSHDHWLSVPLSEIKRQVEQEEFEEKLRITTKTAEPKEPLNIAGSKLWVDKYAPASFADLLSDERVNRNVLIWLKEWSGTVFGEKFVNPLPRVRYQRTPTGQSIAVTDIVEPKDRPDHLCVLISGPPGIGKTTLAHILAKQAGFHAVEFNASDDRTASSFMPKVLDVVGTESRFGNSKPKALIIDEIDGALGGEGKGAIDALAKFLDEKKLKRPIICICNDVWAPALRPLRDRSLQFRLEPPSMTNLVSRLEMICTREGVSVESQLLQAICELTNRDIRSCLNTLQFLSRKSARITAELFASTSFGNKDMSTNIFDIWKTIFLKEEEQRGSIMEVLLASSSGSRRSGESRDGQAQNIDNASHYNSKPQIERISAMVRSNKVDRVLDGVHENVLLVKYHDPMFQKTTSLTQWFQFYDELQSQVAAKQLFALSAYLPYVGSAANLLCCTSTSHQYMYPRSARVVRDTKQVNEATIQSFLANIVPPLRPYLDLQSIVTDFASYLVRILAPHLRPVNITLFNSNERARLASLVTVHLAYGINYVETSTHQVDYPEDEERMAMWKKRTDTLKQINNTLQPPRIHLTSHSFGLQPPIHRVTHYSPIPKGAKVVAKDVNPQQERANQISDFDATSDSVRQVVSGAIHEEKLKRLSIKANDLTEEQLLIHAQKAVEAAKGSNSAKRETTASAVAAAGAGANIKGGAKKSGAATETEHFAKDFFGRKIAVKAKTSASSNPKTATNQHEVDENGDRRLQFFYKYQEGKTDAVRRKVLMKDLL